eukprot:IDg13961t1
MPYFLLLPSSFEAYVLQAPASSNRQPLSLGPSDNVEHRQFRFSFQCFLFHLRPGLRATLHPHQRDEQLCLAYCANLDHAGDEHGRLVRPRCLITHSPAAVYERTQLQSIPVLEIIRRTRLHASESGRALAPASQTVVVDLVFATGNRQPPRNFRGIACAG